MGLTVGLPRMHQEAGERRDFLPSLVSWLHRADVDAVVIESGYGAAMDVPEAAYREASSCVRFATYEECLQQDIVLVLRCPSNEDLARLRPGCVFLSMLHFATRPQRVRLMLELGVHAIGIDSIVDDRGRRLVENLETVAWTGVREAFRQLRRRHPEFDHPGRRPLHVTCLGSGAVGGYAVHAATRYGDPLLREALWENNVPGIEVTVVDFDLTWHEEYMRRRLSTTDLLIDASARADVSVPIVPNAWVAGLPKDAVLLDLAADPYALDARPPVVKGIEGMPHGNLDEWVFPVGHPAWDEVDRRVDTKHRRLALSCYSWPGLDPVASMRTYGAQLEPVLHVVLTKPPDGWDVDGSDHQERATARAEVSRWARAH